MSVLARSIEAEGLPTVTIVLLREHAEKVKPPRALFVPFPYGYPLGRPDDGEFQHRVLGASLALFDAPRGYIRLTEEWTTARKTELVQRNVFVWRCRYDTGINTLFHHFLGFSECFNAKSLFGFSATVIPPITSDNPRSEIA